MFLSINPVVLNLFMEALCRSRDGYMLFNEKYCAILPNPLDCRGPAASIKGITRQMQKIQYLEIVC